MHVVATVLCLEIHFFAHHMHKFKGGDELKYYRRCSIHQIIASIFQAFAPV